MRDARIQLTPYLLLFLAGAAISLVAAAILSASRPGFLLLCAALLRATLLARAPDLSDDVFRYLWDGRLASRGISPYAFAPENPALARVAPALASRVAHGDARTVYPPVAQAAFRVFGSPEHLLAWKSFVAAADLSVVALLASGGGPGGGFAAALYAFHPLPVTESAGQGHVDCLGVALLLASLSHLARGRRALAGVAFSMSVLTKYVSLAAVIPLFRKGRCKFLAAAALFASILWLGAWRPGASPAAGLRGYATRWDFNSPLYGAAVGLMDASRLPERAKAAFVTWKTRSNDPPWTQDVFPYFYSAFFARVLLASLLAITLIAAARATRNLEAATFASLAALLLFSPTLYPWYLLWILPFAAKRREPAFLFLSFCAPISYALLYPLRGVSRGLILACEFVPFAVLLAWTLGSARRRASV